MNSHLADDSTTPISADPLGLGPSAHTGEDRWGAALVALGRRAVTSANVELLMHDAAALLAESLDGDVSGVAEVLDGGTSLNIQLTATQPDVQLVSPEQRTRPQRESSLAGYALAVAHPVSMTDLSRETRFTDMFLRRQRIRSGVACPLKQAGNDYGVLLVGKREAHIFSEDDLLYVEAIGHLITSTIARERAEQSLAEQLRLDAAVLDTIEALVVVLDPETRIQQFNRACQEIAGFTVPELRQRAFGSALLVPEEVRIVKEALDQVPHSSGPVEFDSYVLTKHGQRRRVAWAFTQLLNGQGKLESLIGTGIDITEKCDLEAKLQRARALAGHAPQRAQSADKSHTLAAQEADDEQARNARPFQELPPGEFGDRRSRPRRAYPYGQRMACVINGRMPKIEEFREVQCRDLGAGGFSFFAERPPKEPNLVVAFGAGETLTFMTARQIHLTPTSRNGRSLYIVGCRYTGRASYDDASLSLESLVD